MTTTYRIFSQQSGADLGTWETSEHGAGGIEDVLRQLADAAGDRALLAEINDGHLWTCITNGGMRGEIGALCVVPV